MVVLHCTLDLTDFCSYPRPVQCSNTEWLSIGHDARVIAVAAIVVKDDDAGSVACSDHTAGAALGIGTVDASCTMGRF